MVEELEEVEDDEEVMVEALEALGVEEKAEVKGRLEQR